MKVYEWYEVRVNGSSVTEPLRYLEQAITTAFFRAENVDHRVTIHGGDFADVRRVSSTMVEIEEYILDPSELFECIYLPGDPVGFELRLVPDPYVSAW